MINAHDEKLRHCSMQHTGSVCLVVTSRNVAFYLAAVSDIHVALS